MHKIDLAFLQTLRHKLKGGNLNSIHLNTLPGRYAARLDIAHLNRVRNGFGDQFLDMLFRENSFEFKITFDEIDFNTITVDEQRSLGELSKRLNALFNENDDNFKEHGTKTFGFGYPILIKRSKKDPAKLIKAPLLIWSLDIVKSENKVNTWSILRNKVKDDRGRIVKEDVHPVEFNDVLRSYVQGDDGITLPQVNEELLEDAIVNRDELFAICCNVFKSLNALTPATEKAFRDKLELPVTDVPLNSSLDTLGNTQPLLHFAGVFGLFRTQKESIVSDLDRLIERYTDFKFDQLIVEKFGGSKHSAVETDPSQQEILNTLAGEPRKIIQGPPGTGKSQSLTALITTALANKKKCLVVCEKKTALDVVKQNLHRIDPRLGVLVAVIEDIGRDRDQIVTSVRERINSQERWDLFNSKAYTTLSIEVETAARSVNEKHRALSMDVHNGNCWTNLVGQYLKRAKKVSASTLDSKLDFKDFKLQDDPNELAAILKVLPEAKRIYEGINTLSHPLEVTNDALYNDGNPRGVQLTLEKQLTTTLSEVEKAIANLSSELTDYSSWLTGHYDGYYQSVEVKLNEFSKLVSDSERLYGNGFYDNSSLSNIKISVLAFAFKKYKDLRVKRSELITRTFDIKRAHAVFDYVPHEFFLDPKAKTLRAYCDNIQALSASFKRWYETNEAVKRNYEQTFSSHKLHPSYKANGERLTLLERRLVELFNLVTSAKILKRVHECPAVLPGALSKLEALRKDLNRVREHLTDFRPYYEWRTFYAALSAQHQRIISALIETNVRDWTLTFECWYYHWLLAVNEKRYKFPNSDDDIRKLLTGREEFKSQQTTAITSYWSERQKQSVALLQATGQKPNAVFNQRGARGQRRNSLRYIIHNHFNLFSDFYPVVMVSPSVCGSIIPLVEGLFDVVIFDEASQLRLEDTFTALLRGGIKVVSGDSQQMPPSSYFQGGNAMLASSEEDEGTEFEEEEQKPRRDRSAAVVFADSESLLEYAEMCHYKSSFLKVHYRSQHPHLIDFSNNAFYGKRLIPLPAKRLYKAIRFVAVNGVYEEQTNKEEAKKVVEILLNHIKPFKDGSYPSVGVATFNIYQRNLIKEEITKARQLDSANDKKIAELGPDFFVKNLENIQGDERDVMIISTTFGRKPDGTFRQFFGPITQSNGYKLLNVIVTRAKYKVYVCSSIPADRIEQYQSLADKGRNTGKEILYAYLAYAKAVEDGNEEKRLSILNLLYNNAEFQSVETIETGHGSESPFEEEVFERLAQRIGASRMEQQYRVGGFRIDLVIKSKITGKPMIALECDGAKYHSSNEAYSWDLFRQKQLEEHNFKFYRLWSTNWWNDTDKELDRVVDFILDVDWKESQTLTVSEVEPFFEEEPVYVTVAPKVLDKKSVVIGSTVTVKNAQGKEFKVRISRNPNNTSMRAETDGIISIYEKTPLAVSLAGKRQGETCQLGALEVYYNILQVE